MNVNHLNSVIKDKKQGIGLKTRPALFCQQKPYLPGKKIISLKQKNGKNVLNRWSPKAFRNSYSHI
jgi:hypothetical protein